MWGKGYRVGGNGTFIDFRRHTPGSPKKKLRNHKGKNKKFLSKVEHCERGWLSCSCTSTRLQSLSPSLFFAHTSFSSSSSVGNFCVGGGGGGG